MHLRRTRICPHRRLFRARPFDSDSNGTLGPSQIPASDSWLRKTFLRTLRLAPCQKSYDRKREPAIKIEAGSPRVAFFSLWCANKDNSFRREIHALNLPSCIGPGATMVVSSLALNSLPHQARFSLAVLGSFTPIRSSSSMSSNNNSTRSPGCRFNQSCSGPYASIVSSEFDVRSAAHNSRATADVVTSEAARLSTLRSSLKPDDVLFFLGGCAWIVQP